MKPSTAENFRPLMEGKQTCLNATGDLAFVIPSYVFATPVLGGQAAVSVIRIYGRTSTSLAGTLTGALTVPAFGVDFQ